MNFDWAFPAFGDKQNLWKLSGYTVWSRETLSYLEAANLIQV